MENRMTRLLLYRLWVFMLFFCVTALFFAIGHVADGVYYMLAAAYALGIISALLTLIKKRWLYNIFAWVCAFAPVFILPGASAKFGAAFLGIVFLSLAFMFRARNPVLDIYGVSGQFALYLTFLLLSVIYPFEPIRIAFNISNLTMLILFAIYLYADNLSAAERRLRGHVQLALFLLLFTVISLPFALIRVNPFSSVGDIYYTEQRKPGEVRNPIDFLVYMWNSITHPGAASSAGDMQLMRWILVGLLILIILIIVIRKLVKTRKKQI